MAKIKFLGASSGIVTGSCYLLQGQNTNLLIDFGMFQGTWEIDQLNFKLPEIDVSRINAVLLTHAHLDHCGRLPLLVKMGYKGPIYMTRATKDLTELSLEDSAKVAKENHRNGKQVLYTSQDVETIVNQFEVFDYDENFRLGEFEVTPRDAGHILGSASLEVVDKAGKSIVFSGDLGNTPQDIIKKTENIAYADIVLMESTYGDKVHPKEDSKQVLADEINQIESSGSTLLIPAFSLERTQELLHIIHHLKLNGLVKNETQVFLDSPMAQKATVIFRAHRELFNPELSQDQSKSDPFSFPGLRFVESHQESERLNKNKGAQVILAGSGMMTGGRITHHAANFLPDDSTRLLFVGYQAEGTLGRQIIQGAKSVKIEGKEVHIRAQISEMHGLSSHADQPKLLLWLKAIEGVKKVFLVHGEDTQRNVLKQKINDDLGIKEITLPKLDQEIFLQ